MIGVINAKSGNIGSLTNALSYINVRFEIINSKRELENFKKVILPGVGAFSMLKKNLIELNMFNSINEFLSDEQNSFLGICVGMQILLSKSTEDGLHTGFNWFKGEVMNFNSIKKVKTPNINWLSVNVNKNNDLIDNRDDETFYFLHSYFCNIVEKDKILATSNYSGIEFP